MRSDFEFAISVIIPTFQRRELLVRCVRAVDRQEFSGGFEVIVVVDGSTDGSADVIRQHPWRNRVVVIEQSNRGAAAARNQGAAVARGRALLFLDDDMEAQAGLLEAHQRRVIAGAHVVRGSMPLHPDSPRTIISQGVGLWWQSQSRTEASRHGPAPWYEVLSGHLCVRADVFEKLGGFDGNFTRDGTYGNEDYDFAYRLIRSGYEVAFAPDAVAAQHYRVSASEYLRQAAQTGRADVALARKHPELNDDLFRRSRRTEWRRRGLAAIASRILKTTRARPSIEAYLTRKVDAGVVSPMLRKLFFGLRTIVYWDAVWKAGGPLEPRRVRVLCYHSISDLIGDPVLEQYGIPQKEFEAQIDWLTRHHFHFIKPDEFVRFLKKGDPLPRRPVLLTFDDGYRDFLDAALPVFETRELTGVIFVPTGRIGQSNKWDQRIGSRSLELMTMDDLGRCVAGGIAIGAHSDSHVCLTDLPDGKVRHEIGESVARLRRCGLLTSGLFSYPHGCVNDSVKNAAAECNVEAAFGVQPGYVTRRSDPLALPRVVILRRHRKWRFAAVVACAGWPGGGLAAVRTRSRRAAGALMRRARLGSARGGTEAHAFQREDTSELGA